MVSCAWRQRPDIVAVDESDVSVFRDGIFATGHKEFAVKNPGGDTAARCPRRRRFLPVNAVRGDLRRSGKCAVAIGPDQPQLAIKHDRRIARKLHLIGHERPVDAVSRRPDFLRRAGIAGWHAINDIAANDPDAILKDDAFVHLTRRPGGVRSGLCPVNAVGGMPHVIVMVSSVESAEQPDFAVKHDRAVKNAIGQIGALGQQLPGLKIRRAPNRRAKSQVKVIALIFSQRIDGVVELHIRRFVNAVPNGRQFGFFPRFAVSRRPDALRMKRPHTITLDINREVVRRGKCRVGRDFCPDGSRAG